MLCIISRQNIEPIKHVHCSCHFSHSTNDKTQTINISRIASPSLWRHGGILKRQLFPTIEEDIFLFPSRYATVKRNWLHWQLRSNFLRTCAAMLGGKYGRVNFMHSIPGAFRRMGNWPQGTTHGLEREAESTNTTALSTNDLIFMRRIHLRSSLKCLKLRNFNIRATRRKEKSRRTP